MFAKFKRRKELKRLYERLALCELGTQQYDKTLAEIRALLENTKFENELDPIPTRPIIVSAASALISGFLMVLFANYKEANYIPNSLSNFLENKIKKDSDQKDDYKPMDVKK